MKSFNLSIDWSMAASYHQQAAGMHYSHCVLKGRCQGERVSHSLHTLLYYHHHPSCINKKNTSMDGRLKHYPHGWLSACFANKNYTEMWKQCNWKTTLLIDVIVDPSRSKSLRVIVSKAYILNYTLHWGIQANTNLLSEVPLIKK